MVSFKKGQIVARFTAILIVLYFLVSAFAGITKNNSGCIAKIGNFCLTIDSFNNTLRKHSLATIDNKRVSTLSKKQFEVLQFIVSDILYHKLAKDFNISITDDTIAEIIKNNKLFENSGSFSLTKFKDFLSTNNINEHTYSEALKSNIISYQISSLFYPINYQIEKIIDQNFDLSIFEIDPKSFKVDVNEKDIVSFYKEREKYFFEQEKRFITLLKSEEIKHLNCEALEKYRDEIKNMISNGFDLKKISNKLRLSVNNLILTENQVNDVKFNNFVFDSAAVIGDIGIVEQENCNFVVIQIDNVKKAQQLPLDSTLRESIKQDLLKQKSTARALGFAKDALIKNDINQIKDFIKKNSAYSFKIFNIKADNKRFLNKDSHLDKKILNSLELEFFNSSFNLAKQGDILKVGNNFGPIRLDNKIYFGVVTDIGTKGSSLSRSNDFYATELYRNFISKDVKLSF
jgi:hypothetical protein